MMLRCKKTAVLKQMGNKLFFINLEWKKKFNKFEEKIFSQRGR